MTPLAWTRFTAALEWYRNLGYVYREVPWLVNQNSIFETCPEVAKLQSVTRDEKHMGCLVGSGEQGFIDELLSGELEPGRYMTITPCFRAEDRYDRLTRPWFMKLELFDNTREPRALRIVEDACNFMRRWIRDVRVVETEIGQDIVTADGVELGSYGLRRLSSGQEFMYGTGLAEPRFTNCWRKNP